MKLHSSHTHESTMTTRDTGTFSIAVNGKAFSILLDGLYSNKIRAVIRELWTNAYDSHLDAGIGGIPFDVHLPTRMDPTFRVRDYGVSLSHEDVMGLYTTLFDSTKDDSNDVVGALGLGSKSPFAYTDTFTVVARLDGHKRTYLAAIGADGTPTITLIADVESDEAQGLEVSIAVKDGDFYEFEQEARGLAIGFDPVPAVDGIELETAVPTFVASDASFAVFSPDTLPSESAVWIRQGCVIYPVTERTLTHPITNVLMYRHACIINVPIGAVGIVASREGLSLDTDTVEAVRAAVERTAEKMQQEINDKVEAMPNLLAALEYWNGEGREYRQVFRFTPTYRGEALTGIIPIPPEKKGGEHIKVKAGNRKGISDLKGIQFSQRDHLKFVVRRTDKPVKREMTRYRDAVTLHGGNDSGIYLLVDPPKSTLKRLVRLLGLRPDQIVNISELPDNGPSLRGPASTRVTGVYRLDGRYYHKPVVEFDPTVPYVWVEIDRISQSAASTCFNLQERAHLLGITVDRVYMFTTGAVKRYKPEAKTSLRNMIEAKRKAEEARWKKDYTQHLIVSGVGELASHLGYSNSQVLGYDQQRIITTNLDSAILRACEAEAALVTDKVKAKYPLLFDRYNDEATKAYIALCDAQEAP